MIRSGVLILKVGRFSALPMVRVTMPGITRNYSQLNYSQIHSRIRQRFPAQASRYSTKTAPPPPPPPPKNARSSAILLKITRAFTFSFSSIMVIGAVGLSGLVIYLILSELFLPSGDTKTFNKAVKLVEKNELAQQALGFKAGERLKAYGEVPGDRWVRNRPVQSVRQKGQDGKDHLAMRFHVESPSGKHGSVILEQIDTSFWSSEFAYVALELPSKKRIYIVEPKFAAKNYVPRSKVGSGFLGLNWGPKKD